MISTYTIEYDHNSGKLISKNNKTFVQCITGNFFLKKVVIQMA